MATKEQLAPMRPLHEVTGAMGYLMDWSAPHPPEYITKMDPEELVSKLRSNLYEAADKLNDLAHRHSDGNQEHPELTFFADALRSVSRGKPIGANPYIALE